MSEPVDERLEILRMLQDGKISAEEAARLLEALSRAGGRKPREAARWFRLRVYDAATGRSRINVNLPVDLLELGAGLVRKIRPDGIPALEGLDLDEILTSVKAGAAGKLAEIEDEEQGIRVEITVD